MGVQEIIEAIPSAVSGDEPDGDKLRTELVQGIVGFIPDDASVVTGVMQVDPVDAELGGVRQAYVYGDGTFKYDALDTTTAHDGVYVLNLIGGRRYKRLGVPTIASVMSRSVETPPDPDDVVPENRPQFGDAYLFLTGSWAAEGIAVNSIAVWSSIGGGSWQEVEPTFGPPLYIRDEDAYVRWTGDDGWLDGLGSGSYPASSIPPSTLIWDGRVQNQTTNAPPSAAQGVAYIIGSTPTGAWAGNAGKIAIRESAGTSADYVIYTPKVGQVVYDIALGIDVRWSGLAWEPASGVIIFETSVFTANDAFTPSGSGAYGYSATAAPPSANLNSLESLSITRTSRRTGAKIEITYSCDHVVGSPGLNAVALFRDNESAAIDWTSAPQVTGHFEHKFLVSAIDTSAHTYKIRIMWAGSGANGTITRRTLQLKEYA